MTTVLAAAGAGAVALAGTPTLGTPAFAVTPHRGGDVVVRVVDTSADAEQMSAQLAAAGLDIRVETVAANPQVVGSWVAASADETTDEAVYADVVEQALGYPEDVVVPADVTGLTLVLGVRPDPGQEPSVVGMRNAFAPGQPLACSPARGAGVEAATALLTDQGFAVRTVTMGSLGPVQVDPTDVATIAFRLDEAPDVIMLVTSEPDDPRLQARLDHGFSPRALADGDGCR